MNVKTLGQVFTPETIVDRMISLMKNHGSILEPSCGNGAFSSKLKQCTAIEIDADKAPKNAIVCDFFDFNGNEKFDTVIGNPPYVRYQDISDETKEKLDKFDIFDKRTNLFMFFIYKCFLHLKPHGELIFIVPRAFFKATSAKKLNEILFENGTFTDVFDLGDQKMFDGADPNCVIFRYEFGNASHMTNDGRKNTISNGQLIFSPASSSLKFKDVFFVKVGAVSGDDEIFANANGNAEFVCSYTQKTGQTKRMVYDVPSKLILPYKERLMARKIKSFSEADWFMFGREYFVSDKERIYVNGKTRNRNPFFCHPCKKYDGSVLAIFPKIDASWDQVMEMAEMLNRMDWSALGFLCGTRYIFSQRSLENCPLPEEFGKFAADEK